jgi:uncharacterized protein (TIGR03437 family)
MRFLILLAILVLPAYSADFTTYIGGTSPTQSIAVSAIATDSAGNTYVTGSNAFVTKLDLSGNIVFTASIGPIGSYGNAIAVDRAGNIWVGGQTTANDFPLVNPLQSSGGYGTGFLVKMAPDGTVAYSSYLGGVLGNSGVNGVATDPNGNVYVTGFTDASDFPTTAGLPASPVTGSGPPVYGLFAAKLNSTGQKILYSTVIAGMNCASCGVPNVPRTVGIGIAVDGSGNAVVAGDTNSTDLPFNSGPGAPPGPFVFKINAAGNELVYFIYLGYNASVGSFLFPDTAAASPIAVDASGNVYVAGYNQYDGFATKLSPSGGTIGMINLLGGYPSMPNGIALDSSGDIWATGTILLPFSSPARDESIYELNPDAPDGVALLYSAQFPQGEAGQAIAIDPSGTVHFAGSSGFISTITPAQPFAPRALSIVNAASEQLSGTIAPGEIISIYGLGLGPATGMTAAPENGQFPTSLGGVQVLVNGSPIPLLYVSASQINAEIPSPLNGVENRIVVVQVMSNSAPLPDFRLAVTASVFGAFYSSGAYLAVTNQDGMVNSNTNPAKAGSYVSLWATGFGSVPGVTMDGSVATVANNYCDSCLITFVSFDFRATETVQYAGPSPGLIDGLMQINVMIPTAQSPTPQLQVLFNPPGAVGPRFLGFVWVSQ